MAVLADVSSTEVAQAWWRITAWLDARAPATARAIRPAATEHQIRTAETELGVEVPDDLHFWWTVMDGIDDARESGAGSLIPAVFTPLPVADVLTEHEALSRFPDCTGLIPICRAPHGEMLAVDLRESGDRGRVVDWTPERGYRPTEWSGIAEMLADTADSLDNAVPGQTGPDRTVVPVIGSDGALNWDEPTVLLRVVR
jgi:hypothetical protein